jgi:ATP-binding cassette subfamily B protein
MTSDTAIIENVVGTTVSVALRNTLTGLGGIGFLVFLAPSLTLGLLIGIPLVVVPIVYFGRKIRAVSRTSQDRIADVGAYVTEVLSAMKIVQSFGQEKREGERFASVVEGTFATARRRIMLRAAMTTVVILLVFGGVVLVMWRGALAVAAGEISGGTIAAFVLTGGLVAGALGALTEVYGDLLRGAGAASRLAELLEAKPEIAPPARPERLPEPARGSLSFRNVTFRYPSRPETAALKDFTLEIEPGETIAIVGPSGAGKSTIFQLVERFYDPQGGTIRMDGVPLTSADPTDIRARLALVPQDGVLFSANARDNLRYGKWNASDEQIWQAARAANAEGFLRALPQGLDTYLGEGGTQLSGGQQQMVAIGRALMSNPRVLLCDEISLGLAPVVIKDIYAALPRIRAGGASVIVVEQDIGQAMRVADRVYCMMEGRVTLSGRPADLSRAAIHDAYFGAQA